MKASEFVIELNKIKPTKEQLSTQNLSEDFINEFIASYECIPKKEFKSKFDSELLNLFENFDVSKIVIGMITFNSVIEVSENYFFIGKVEIDSLVLDKHDDSLKVISSEDDSSILWECAENSDRFLEALIVLAKFLTQRMFNDDLWEDLSIGEGVAANCSVLAGGDKYADFYKMLLS